MYIWMLTCILGSGMTMASLAAAERAPEPVAQIIDTTVVRQSRDGELLRRRSSSRHFRDARGRTRTERGRFVTLFDPVSGFFVLLDTDRRSARVVRYPAAGPTPAEPRAQLPSGTFALELSREVDLGVRLVNHARCHGRRQHLKVPAEAGKGPSGYFVRELWVDEGTGMTLLSILQSGLDGSTVVQWASPIEGVAIDDSLFEIPEGFTVDLQGDVDGTSPSAMRSQVTP